MLARKRKVVLKSGALIETPLLLPSFSSKTFQDEGVGKIIEYMAPVITDEVLISAYDLFYGAIKKRMTFPSAVFIDSGGYEASLDSDLSETGKKRHTPRRWVQDYHRRALRKWDYSLDTILISFDSPKAKTSVANQINRAKRLFSEFPKANSEILFKTISAKEDYLGLSDIVAQVHDLASFDIIGFTEKELGESTLERMCNIAKIRKALSAAGMEKPIHIFGSLDTVSTPLYFISGADVFDGLTWLRFAFDEGQTVYKHNYGAKRMGIRLEDFRVNGTVWNSNYYYMRKLKDDMLKFLAAGDYSSFAFNGGFLKTQWFSLRQRWRSKEMGGGGGGGGAIFYRRSPEELQQEIRAAELASAEAEFQPILSKKLNEFLRQVNDRNSELTNKRLDLVKEILKAELEQAIALKFGGSVAKHTYVDGLSDVDLLLVLKEYGDAEPNAILNDIAGHLAEGLGREVNVSRGRIAVTLTYRDGEEIQLIPAVRKDGALHVPAWIKAGWSAIDPDGFRKALVKQNEKCASKLVPTIKLAKAINATLPEAQQLSGYHIEAMAIQAFKAYDGTYVVERMLPHLMRQMAELVKAPIRDSSGQSIHVDEYLGRPNGVLRKRMSHVLDRIFRRMENATAARSLEQWTALLGE